MSPLETYRDKRDFEKTAEPEGRASRRRSRAAEAGGAFVIHKHAARRLHYDLRLQMDGVLRSWAVPKGPSLDPAVKRLAVHVEDHPLEYGAFEGVIPKGEYGGGTVMIWDAGLWEPIGDAPAGYLRGELKFRLDGQRLHGAWVLVRLKGRSESGEGAGDGRDWLLIKERDAEAQPGGADPWGDEDRSVTSRRTMSEIAAASRAAGGARAGVAHRLAPAAHRRRGPPHRPPRRASRWPRSSTVRPTATTGCTRSSSTATASWRAWTTAT